MVTMVATMMMNDIIVIINLEYRPLVHMTQGTSHKLTTASTKQKGCC